MQTEWWKSFFSGVVLDFWRAAMSEELTRLESDFIEKMLQLRPQAKVLDVPCGNGRHSLELASRGYRLTGVDFSHEFIDEARAKAAERQLKISWEHREMRELPWQEEFDGVFCFGNSFGYLDDDGNAKFLEAVAHALKPGARLILDASSIAETILPKFQERSKVQVGDIMFLEENRYDHVRGRMDTEYTFVREGKVEKKFGSHRIYTYHEVSLLLKETGFMNCEAYGSLQQELFKLGSERLFLVATKK